MNHHIILKTFITHLYANVIRNGLTKRGILLQEYIGTRLYWALEVLWSGGHCITLLQTG